MVEFLGLMEGSVVGQREAIGSAFTFEKCGNVERGVGLSGPHLACSGCFLKFSSMREKQVALRKIQA